MDLRIEGGNMLKNDGKNTVLPIIASCMIAFAATTARADRPHPNLVVILADDLGYGDVSCYNPDGGKIQTPNIDRLAAEGMSFTDAHSSSSVCSPSRYTLLTGRYHWRTRLQASVISEFGKPLIAANQLTLPALLKEQGYRTACFGKWHLGWDWPIPKGELPAFRIAGTPTAANAVATDRQRAAWQAVFSQPIPGGPTERGFDQYFGIDVPSWPPFCFIENDRTVGVPSELLPLKVRRQGGAPGPAVEGWAFQPMLPTVTDRACEFITAAHGSAKPFFLYFPLTSPHTPLAVNKEWQGKSGLGPYADFVMETDHAVGRVLDILERSGAAKNTLVVFSSDNGFAPYVGAQGLEKKGHYPSGPLRGYKTDAWEGGHRVPFLVRWPGIVQAGTRCDHLVLQGDLMATCAEIVGATLPEEAAVDSVSLLPLLQGADRPVRESAVQQSSQGLFVVRKGQWKLIAGPGSGGLSPSSGGLPAQLYDLAADLGETKNVYQEKAELATELLALLEKMVADGRSTPGPKQSNDVPVNWTRFLGPDARKLREPQKTK